MKRFTIVVATKTNLELIATNALYSFEIGTSIVSIREINDPKDKIISRIKRGLIIEIQLNEKNIENAINKAVGMCEFFLSALCLEIAVPIPASNVILAYEISENIKKRQYRQYFHYLGYSGSNNKVPFSPFDKNSNKINELKGKYKFRIYRAIRWFRKGILSHDPIDQFIFFWQGLESLNSALTAHFDVKKTKKIERKCKICQNTYKDEGPSIGGIEALYDDMGIEESIRTEIKQIRNGIAHGYRDISELYEPTIKLNPFIAKILHCGISKLIKISYGKILYKNLKNVAPVKIGDSIYIEGFLNEKDISKLGVKNYYPYWDPKIRPKILQEGNITFNFEPQYNLTGCQYIHTAIGISGKGIDVKIK